MFGVKMCQIVSLCEITELENAWDVPLKVEQLTDIFSDHFPYYKKPNILGKGLVC